MQRRIQLSEEVQSWDSSHSMLEAAKKKWWCIRLIRLCQIIYLQATVTQEERRGVTEYQLPRVYIYRYIISHQDIKSFHGETIQMRSSPFSAWRSLLCLGLRLKNRLNSLNVDLTSTLLRVITHKPSQTITPSQTSEIRLLSQSGWRCRWRHQGKNFGSKRG